MTGPPPDQARLDRVMAAVHAATLVLEGLTLLLVPRTVAPVGRLTGLSLGLVLALAVVLVVLAGVQRRPWGYTAGSVAQVAFLATGFLVGAMFVLGVVFGSIWFYTRRVHRQLASGPARPPQ